MQWACLACGQVERGGPPSVCICGLSDTFEPVEPELAGTGREPTPGARARPLTEAGAELRLAATRERRLDRALGGGVLIGSTVSVYGPEGCGKSTLCYRWAAGIGRTLLVTPEMARDLVLATAKRSGAPLEQIYNVHELSGWRGEATRLGARAVVIDSLSSGRAPLRLLSELINWSASSDGVGFAIAHESKKRRALGPVGVTHDPDAVIRVTRGKNAGRALVTLKKCRYAPSSSFEVELLGTSTTPI